VLADRHSRIRGTLGEGSSLSNLKSHLALPSEGHASRGRCWRTGTAGSAAPWARVHRSQISKATSPCHERVNAPRGAVLADRHSRIRGTLGEGPSLSDIKNHLALPWEGHPLKGAVLADHCPLEHLPPPRSVDRRVHDAFLGGLIARKLHHHLALFGHQDAVGQGHHFRQIR
jgi:hypothetical protein